MPQGPSSVRVHACAYVCIKVCVPAAPHINPIAADWAEGSGEGMEWPKQQGWAYLRA